MKWMDRGQPPGSVGFIRINYTWKIAPHSWDCYRWNFSENQSCQSQAGWHRTPGPHPIPVKQLENIIKNPCKGNSNESSCLNFVSNINYKPSSLSATCRRELRSCYLKEVYWNEKNFKGWFKKDPVLSWGQLFQLQQWVPKPFPTSTVFTLLPWIHTLDHPTPSKISDQKKKWSWGSVFTSELIQTSLTLIFIDKKKKKESCTLALSTPQQIFHWEREKNKAEALVPYP